jgi:hypothetical protein
MRSTVALVVVAVAEVLLDDDVGGRVRSSASFCLSKPNAMSQDVSVNTRAMISVRYCTSLQAIITNAWPPEAKREGR